MDSCTTVSVRGMWERPACANFYLSRFAGHFSTALYDMKGRRLQYYDGWYDGGDITREYDLSAGKNGLQKGDVVTLCIYEPITSLFRGFPEWSKGILQKKLNLDEQAL